MKYFHCLWLILFCAGNIWAQQENIWILGNAGMDFNNPAPSSPAINGQQFGEAAASVCDNNGQLLFYTEGSRVWNRQHNQMPNGSALTTIALNATGSSTQGACIVPIPGQDQQYYVFSLTSLEFGVDAGKLFYSKIDMGLDGGLGDVVAGQKAIYLGDGLTEKLVAVAGSHCNMWVITRSRMADEFKAYEITASGVNPNPVISATGLINFNQYILGTLTVAPDSKKILSAAAHAGGGGLELFDFDQATGMLSNPKLIDNSLPFYSACFSPDQSKVYAINYLYTGNVYQYDLNAVNPSSSQALVRQGVSFFFDKIKLAANNKVYLRGGNNFLDVINLPDLAAPACAYAPNAVNFGTTMISGALPNTVPVFVQTADSFSSVPVQGPCWALNFPVQGNAAGWDYQSNGSHQGPVIAVDTPGVYWLSYYTAPCRFHTDTFVVTFPKGVLPDIHITPACRSGAQGSAKASTYPGDPVTYSYIWLNGTDTLSTTDSLVNRQSGSYAVAIATNTGCDTILYFDIPAIDPRLSFQLSDTLVCLGEPIQFNNSSNEHYTQLRWDFGDGVSSTDVSPLYTYPLPGSYTVTLMGKGSVCSDTLYTRVTVDAPMDNFRFLQDRHRICTGEKIQLQPDTAVTLELLTWDFGDGIGFNHTLSETIQHAYDQEGLMWISMKAQFRACPDVTYTDSVVVYPIPNVFLGQDSVLCLNGAAILLYNQGVPPDGAFRLLWSTGDTGQILKVVHPGFYSLQVIAEPAGCTGTESIRVDKDCYTDIPNVFTPNNDGYNDYFFPRQSLSRSLSSFRMQILDRWGQLIFETDRTDGRGWDGKFNGKNQPSGVYVYLIEFSTNGRQERYQGNVTLLR